MTRDNSAVPSYPFYALKLCKSKYLAVAERVGFEPTIRFWRILTFQASAFDHSATAPHCSGARALAVHSYFRKA